MNKNDLVSIIIPIYNRIEIALKTSILSVFNQSHTNWELIIIDDGSTDAAREEIGLLMEKDKRIKYFYQENQGQSVARNLGIKIAKGDYVIFLDSDDTLLSKNIETLLSILKKENLDYIYTHPYIFNYKKRGGGIFGISTPNPSCYLFKKSNFETYGFFDPKMRNVEDHDLFINWKIVSKNSNKSLAFKELMIPLAIFLSHDVQATKNRFEMMKGHEMLKEKYIENREVSLNEKIFMLNTLGNLEMEFKKGSEARKNFKESMSLRFNFSALILYLVSFLGKRVYIKFTATLKYLREKIIWRIKLRKAKKNFPESYKEALEISSGFEDW